MLVTLRAFFIDFALYWYRVVVKKIPTTERNEI